MSFEVVLGWIKPALKQIGTCKECWSWHAQYSDMAMWIGLSSQLYVNFAKLTFLYGNLTFKLLKMLVKGIGVRINESKPRTKLK